MADPTNKDQKKISIKPGHTNGEQFEARETEDLAKKKLVEEEGERAFKEGLANNSDTDKNSTQQK